SISINGPGANLLTVRGQGLDSYDIFSVHNAGTVAISGLTVSNGVRGISNGDRYEGGGVSTLTVSNCTVSGNDQGIFNGIGCTLTVSNCTVSGNDRDGAFGFDGGGVLNFDGTAALNSCTITDNGGGWGGGVANEVDGFPATMTIANCTISGNTAY